MNKQMMNGIASAMISMGLLTSPVLASAYAGYVSRGYSRQNQLKSTHSGEPNTTTAQAISEHASKRIKTSDLLHGKKAQARTTLQISRPKMRDQNFSQENKSNKLSIKQHLPVKELLVIDAATPDKHLFYKDLKPGVDVVLIDAESDGLTQLHAALKNYKNLDALHVVAHANDGHVKLGSSTLSESSLNENLELLKQLDDSIADNGDVLFFGCNLAKGEAGEKLLDLIANKANVDVAASNDLTGNPSAGGDWELEVVRGNIASSAPFSEYALKDFSSVLIDYTPADFCTHNSGFCGGNSTETSSDGYLILSGDGTEIRRLVPASHIYTYKSTGYTGAYMQLTATGGLSSFNLTAMTLDSYVDSCSSITITNNNGDTIDSFSSPGTGDHTVTVGTNTTGITSVRMTATGCANSNGFGLKSLSITPASDSTPPTISSVSIPNSAMKVGDVVTASITVTSDTDDYTTGSGGISGTIGGFTLGSLSRISSTSYTAQFTITNGGTDVAAGSNVPVNFTLTDSSGNTSSAFTTAISQASDSIDANIPTITSMTIPNAAAKVGDALTVSILAGEAGLTFISGSVNGVTITGFSDDTGGNYSATYTVAEGNTDRAAGDDIPVSLILQDSSGNNSNTYTTAISQASDSIDANSPTVTNVSIPNSAMKIGDAVSVSITAGEAGLSLNSGTVNGVSVTGFSDDGGGFYSATYTVAEGNTDRAAGDSIPVSFILDDSASNSSSTYTTAITQNADSIDANSPSISSVSIPNSAASVGDAITVTITAGETGLSLNTGTVNGVAVTGFTDNADNTYTATYTVAEGNTDRAAGDSIPVSFILDDSASNSSSTYTTAITQNADSIDANSPSISGVSIPNSAASVGDAIAVTITAGETGLSLNTGTVNGVAVTGFTDNADNTYTATYTVAEGHTDRAAGDDIPVSFILDDSSGNSSSAYTTAISQNADAIDANSPTISNVSIPNSAMKVGDAVTVTITAGETGLSLNSGTVNGVAVTGFTDNADNTYSATYTVAEGHTDRAAGDTIPVSFVLDDSNGNASSTYTTAISQNADSIDANSPTVSAVSIPNSAAKVGDAITVTITAGETGLSLNTGTVNGVAVSGFTDNADNTYTATYTVVEGNTDRAAGDSIPVSFILDDSAGNSSSTYTTAITQNADSIDANSPTISNVSIPNASAKVGDAITVTITAGETGLSLNSGTINGVAVTGFTDNADNTYSATYTVAEGNTDRAAGDNIPVSVMLSDVAGNTSSAFTTAISQAGDAIDANTPTVAEVTAVTTPANDSTPNVTFSTNETGTLSVGGSCGTSSSTTIGSTGNQTITLTQSDNSTPLTEGSYTDCTVAVTDAVGNVSSAVTLSSFSIDLTAPSLSEITAVSTPGNDSTPTVTFSTDETGTLSLGGSCGTSSSTTLSSTGNHTITLTQTDNSTALADGTYTNCTVTVTDAVGNASSALSLTSFTVDLTAPTVAEVTPVTTPGNDNTPSVTFSTNETGTLALGGSCGTSSSTTISSTGNHTITLTQTDNSTALTDATYSDCTLTITDSAGNANSPVTLTSFVVDTTAPTLAEVTAVTTPGNDTTPNVTFSSNEAGTLVMGGSCGTSSSTAVSSGNNTLTLTQTDNSTALGEGTFSNCTVTVTDAAGNASSALSLSSFTVDTTAPSLAEATAVVTPGNDNTPDVTISSDEDGTLAIGGSCGSGSEGAVSAGNITLALTQTDNSTALSDGTFSDCTATVTDAAGNASSALALSGFVVDTAAPTLAEVTAVTSPTSDNTPDVVFSTTEAGNVSIGGSCGTSSSTSVTSGNNTLTLTATDNSTALSDNTYNDCTLTVTDASGNASSALTLSSFIVDIAAPTVAEVTAVTTPGNDTTPSVTISSSEAGTLAVDGSCGSSDEGAISAGNTTITLTATDNSSALSDGTYSDCTVTVTDAVSNASNVLTLASFTIDASAPSLGTNSSLTVNEGDSGSTLGSSQLSASDNLSDAANTTYTLVSVVSNGTLRNNGSALSNGSTFTQADIANNLVTYDHDGGETSSDSFTFTLSDALGNVNNNSSANFSYSISVTAVNDAPSTTDDTASTNEDNAVMVDVLANDADSDDSINAASVTVVTAPTDGSTSINTGTGVITYTPDADFNGSDSFTYTVQDATGDTSAEANVSITVNAVNDAPVASNDMVNTDINTAVSIDVAANDSDVDTGDSVDTTTLAIISGASNGSAVVNAGQIDYTPNTDYLGSDSFTYTIDDSNGATSNVATVTISVIDPNTAPSVANDTASTDEDNAVVVNVLSNDNDPDGSLVPSSVTVVSNASNGSTSVNATTGAITYTPAADFNGSDSFTYTVEDDIGAVSSAATVTITVNSINDAPVANNDMVTLLEDASLSINVLGNDSDVDGTLNAASLTVVTNATSGVAVLDGNNILYTPLDDFAGSDSFTYTVEDNDGLVSNTATVTLTVDPVNDAPLANADSYTIVANAASVLDITSNDSDIDGTLDAASISFVAMPSQGTLSNNNDGTVTYTPAAGVNPLVGDSFSYTIDDNSGSTSATATVTINFEPASVPVLSGTPDTEVIEGESYSFTPTITGADSLYVLTYSITNAPAWASFDTTSGELSGDPLAANVGTTSGIVISVTDGVNTASLPAFDLEVIADIDSDGDTISDHQEDLDGTDPSDPLDYLDLTPPEVMPPADVLLDANALFTPVTLAQVLSLPADATETDITQAINDLVSDNVDGVGCCDLTPSGLVNGMFLLPPGDNVISWQAEDFMNNTTSVSQHVYVRPLVTFSKNQVAVEGTSVSLRILLNGKAPFYPFEVPYVIDSSSTATASDHNLQDGSVTFATGQTSATITFNTLSDSTAENDETLVLRLDDHTTNAQDLQDGFDADIYDINAGVPARFTLTIVERNVAPKLQLSIQQNGQNTIQVTPNGGDVRVTASVTDPNINDSFTLDWTGTDNALTDTSSASETYVFSPTSLSPGRYKVKAKATDSSSATNSAVLHFRVVAALPELSPQNDSDNDGIDDSTEGTADNDDDGIPDYLDNIALPNVLPEQANETNSFLVECDPGVRCRLGEFSIGSQNGGAHLSDDELPLLEGLSDDKGYTSRGIFDFELADLPEAGQTTSVVIPQLVAIPANAVYRKFANNEWRDFVEDANNLLHSAAGTEGFCPPPGDDAWQPGLTEGHWCVQLTIEDGGPNDADGEVNNSVADPGGVATRNARTLKTGGGSFGMALLAMLAALMLSRRFKKGAGGMAVLACVMLLPGESRAQQYPYFVELSAHRSASTQSASQFTSDMEKNSVTATVLDYDSQSMGYQLNFGYQYNTYLAAIVGYLDLGKAAVEMEFLDEDDNVVSKALEESYPHLGKGLIANARFSYPLDDYFSLYADLGVNFWYSKIFVVNSDLEGEVTGVDPWGGVGAKIQYQHFSVRFSYQVFKLKNVGADTLGFGLGYAF
ncbi:OmpA family protein [Alteromonadaceae bacterium 2753L.S.0a.02]|nr:OmpA family protein [Alteromonadaceae bacterium 2753L.S.0a.02]